MVPGASRAPHGLPEADPRHGGSPLPPHRKGFPWEPGPLQAIRLEVIRQALRQRGLSGEVADRVARPQRQSSLDRYQRQWKQFVGWWGERDLYPVIPTVVDISDCLLHLFSTKRLATISVSGHRAAISTTLRAIGTWKQSWQPVLDGLRRNFRVQRPRAAKQFPAWNLALVLNCLMGGSLRTVTTSDGSKPDL